MNVMLASDWLIVSMLASDWSMVITHLPSSMLVSALSLSHSSVSGSNLRIEKEVSKFLTMVEKNFYLTNIWIFSIVEEPLEESTL